MKKTGLILFVALLLAIVALPIVGGYKARQTLEQLVNYTNNEAPGSTTWQAYDKGWFNTTAILNVNLLNLLGMPSSATQSDPMIVPLELSLQHGPVFWAEGFGLGWFKGRWFLNDQQDSWIKEHVQVEGSGPFLTSHFKMSISGLVTFYERSLPFSVLTEDGVFSLAGFEGQGSYSLARELKYKGGFHSASILDEKGRMAVEGLTIELTSDLGRMQGDYAVPGGAHFDVKKMSIINEGDTLFTAENLAIKSIFTLSDPNPNIANMEFKASVQNMQTLDNKITDGVFDLTLERISVAFFNQYMALLQQTNEEGQSQVDTAKLLSLVNRELLPLGPKIHLRKVGFISAEGQLQVDGELSVPPSDAATQSNLFAVLGVIRASLNAKIDKPLAQKLAQQSAANTLDEKMFGTGTVLNDDERTARINEMASTQLDMLVLQNLIRDAGDRFETEMTYKDGVTVVNGQPIPLPF